MVAMNGRRVGAFALLVALLAAFTVSTPALPAGGQTGPSTPADQGVQALIEALDRRTDGHLIVDRDPVTGAVTFVGTGAGTPINAPVESGGDPTAAAGAFVTEFGALFGATSPAALEQVGVDPRVGDGVTVTYRQVTDGVPVLGGELRVQVDGDGGVLSALGELDPTADVDTTAAIDAGAATHQAVLATAAAHGVDSAGLTGSAPELWVYAPDLLGGPEIGGPRLVWRLDVTGSGADGPVDELVLVDATTAGIALQFNQAADGLDRRVCDAANAGPAATPNCVAPFARSEGGPVTGNADVDAAYDHAGDTYAFYQSHFGRDSVDDAGLSLRATVRFCHTGSTCPWVNAFWINNQLGLGAGMALADDVVAHEITHGVTQYTSGLFYYFQSGAINESLSDIFGELIDLTNGRGTDTPAVRWIIGEDVPTGSFRNMADPGATGDADRMTSPNYRDATSDNGGVHHNSGVGNKAAFLLTDGGTFNGHTVPPLGITKVARIFYEAETTLLGSASDYADLAVALPQACTNVIGTDGITAANCAGVVQAVAAVEMATNPPNAPTTDAPTGCANGQVLSTTFSDDLENPSSGNWTLSNLTGIGWAYPQNPSYFSTTDATYATSGDTNFFAPDSSNPSTTYAFIDRSTEFVPRAGSALLFNHAFITQEGFDGGQVQFSTDHGSTWSVFTDEFAAGGYNSHVFGNPAYAAFSGRSNGYGTSRIDLSSLAGQSVKLRFAFYADGSVGGFGWFVDDVRIISCQAPAGRPDAQLRLGTSGTFVGNDVYNGTGTNQSRSANVANRGAATFYARVQNDGNVTEPIKVKGTAGTTRFTVAYFAGTTNITPQVVAGTYQTAALAPGAKTNIKIVVTARSGAPIGSTITLKVKETSTTTTTAKDVVKATVTRNH